jgi:aspartyl-tRNA(Asn)/glutamyl-tRNA(Gln) amidotransferase subunit C
MVKITKEEVKNIANLARIKIEDGELEKYSAEMQSIIEYIEMLNKIDTTQVEPTYQVSKNKNIMQDDIVETGLTREEVLALAKHKDRVNFITKGVFDNE